MLGERIQYGYTYNFLFCYTGAVGLFLLFQPAKSGHSGRQQLLERFRKPVELFSGAAFGVYLIHEHLNLRAVWQQWFHCEVQAENSPGEVSGAYACNRAVCLSALYGNRADPPKGNDDMGSNDRFAAVPAAPCGNWRGFDGRGVCA